MANSPTPRLLPAVRMRAPAGRILIARPQTFPGVPSHHLSLDSIRHAGAPSRSLFNPTHAQTNPSSLLPSPSLPPFPPPRHILRQPWPQPPGKTSMARPPSGTPPPPHTRLALPPLPSLPRQCLSVRRRPPRPPLRTRTHSLRPLRTPMLAFLQAHPQPPRGPSSAKTMIGTHPTHPLQTRRSPMRLRHAGDV